MSAYIVMIRHQTLDPDRMRRYAELAPRAPTAALTIVAAKTCPMTVLEGEPVEAVVILRFPDWDAALAWYDSPEYMAARAHRLDGGADIRAYLVEGMPEG
jgi:uncharacterized protein (DUF1330 family)